MSFGFNLGGSHSSQQGQSWIDPQTSAAQWGNWSGAQQITPNYTPTSAGLIGQYMNPYTDAVVNASLADLGQQNQLALNQVGDSAVAQHAFGGSRQGVAQALTNSEFARQGGLLAAGLRSQGFSTALGAAQQENMNMFQYPLQRQGLLNQTLAGITPHTYTKGSGTTFGGSIQAQFGGK